MILQRLRGWSQPVEFRCVAGHLGENSACVIGAERISINGNRQHHPARSACRTPTGHPAAFGAHRLSGLVRPSCSGLGRRSISSVSDRRGPAGINFNKWSATQGRTRTTKEQPWLSSSVLWWPLQLHRR